MQYFRDALKVMLEFELPIPCNHSLKCHEDIHDSIRQLEQLIASLKSHLNSHSPISRLPSEILAKVFMDTQPVVTEDDIDRKDVNFYVTLLEITRVCRCWRSIALDDPRLWCQIPTGSRDAHWTRTFVERSRDLPITFCGLIVPHSRRISPFELFERHDSVPVDRLQTLAVSVMGYTFSTPDDEIRDGTPLIILPSQSAPQLRSLSLTSSSTRRRLELTPFSGDTPALTSISLKDLDFSWDWIMTLPQLTSLSISKAPRLTSMRQILGVLTKLPNLMRLKLEKAIPDPDETNWPDVIALPRLNQLVLRAPAIPLSYLMDHLCLPKHTTLELDMDTRTEIAMPVFPHALARHYMRTRAPSEAPEDPFRCLVIVQSAMLMCILASPHGMPLYTSPPLEYGESRTAYPLSIAVESNFIPILPWFYQHLTDAFSQSMQFAIDTLVLRVQGRDLLESSDCAWLSYPQLSLKRIVLIGPVFEKFAATFARHDVTVDSAEPRARPDRARLPFLERVKVHSFDFVLPCGRAALAQLIFGLQQRAHAVSECTDGDGDILRICLELCCCDIEVAQVEELRAVDSVDLEWDGKTDGLEVSRATKAPSTAHRPTRETMG